MKTRISSLSIMTIVLLTSCGQNITPLINTSANPVSPTPTQIPSPTVLQPTSSPESVQQAQQAALLYSQDFETGTADGLYDFGQTSWKIITEDTGNKIYCSSLMNDYQEFHFGAYNWANYAVEVRFKALEWRNNPSVSPYVALKSRFEVYKYLQYYGSLNFGYSTADLGFYGPTRDLGHKDNVPAEANTWYTLRLESAGDQIKYFINDRLVLQASDSLLSSGKAGFSVSPDLKVCLDDIRAWALTGDGQIAQLPPQTKPANLGVSDRLATHRFPKLFYQNQDSDPKEEALSAAYFYDLLTFDKESGKTEWAYLGPSGIIRSQNPNSVILATMSIQEYFPQKDNSKTGTEFISGFKSDWAMMDTHGKPFPAFNYGNGEWSTMLNLSTDLNKYIPDFMNDKIMSTSLFDGVFYDGTNESWWQAQPAENRPAGPIDINRDGKADSTAELNAGMDQGLQKLLAETRRVFPTGSLITGNTGWDGSLLLEKDPKKDTILANLINGRMIEGFLNWGNQGIDWFKSMRAYYLMQQVSVEPKTPLIMAYCTGTDYDHLRFVLASSLMYDAYFTCTNLQDFGASILEPYTANWWYDEYSVDLKTGKAVKSLAAKGYLGMPLGEAYSVTNKNILLSTLLVNNDRQAQQKVWRRDYENGIVLVNPSGITVDIDLGGTFRKIIGEYDPVFNDGSEVSKISLPSKSGIILLNLP